MIEERLKDTNSTEKNLLDNNNLIIAKSSDFGKMAHLPGYWVYLSIFDMRSINRQQLNLD